MCVCVWSKVALRLFIFHCVHHQGTIPTEMPSWMAALHKKLNNGPTHPNVRLYIARLITNRPKIFQPYAKYWLPGLTRLIIGGNNGGVGMHYFVVDLMVTILSWSTTAILEVRHYCMYTVMQQLYCILMPDVHFFPFFW